MEKVTTVASHGLSGKIFTFGRTTVEGLENRKPVFYVNVAQEGYVHADNTTFTFKTEDIDPELTSLLGTIIEKLRVVALNEIPSAPGFCFGRGMLIDPVPVEWTEGVALFAGFREHPDLALVFRTRAGLGKNPYDPGRLARNSRADAEMPLWQKPLLKKLRIGHRSINGIDGEEVLERGTELNFVNVFTFDWEVDGTKDNVFVPAMHLELSTGHPVRAGANPVPSFLGEEALVRLWDKISSSIRVRPTKPDSPSGMETAPAGPKLGASASAGDVCPETGWWQCADGGNGIGVLGSQRQFLRKGQRMPQALLLPKQTVWEKLRELQSSYENSQATAWTFVDRRSKERVVVEIPLAPVAGQNGRSVPQGVDVGDAPVSVGNFVRTGTACPAAGWWRCQDSDALDGTRWFAKGDLLPAATFSLAQAKFRFSRQDMQVYQRRSTWQLVRQTTEPSETAS
jgi:Tle cognate immunity protein 4 C-terminal domain